MFEAGLLSEFGFLVSFWHPRRFSQGLDSREQPSGYVWPKLVGTSRREQASGYVQPSMQRPFDLVFCSVNLIVLSLG